MNHKTFVGIWYNLYKKKCTGQFRNFKRPEKPQTTKWLQNFIFYKERPQYLTKWKILLRQMCHCQSQLRDGFMNVNRNCWKQFKLVALKNWKESLNFARKPLRASTALEKKSLARWNYQIHLYQNFRKRSVDEKNIYHIICQTWWKQSSRMGI